MSPKRTSKCYGFCERCKRRVAGGYVWPAVAASSDEDESNIVGRNGSIHTIALGTFERSSVTIPFPKPKEPCQPR